MPFNLGSMGTAAIELDKLRARASVERWYVLVLTCLIYAINIADRYVVSTVLEPIRLDLHLNDAGVAFLTGVPLALFYVTLGIPISWLADRSNRRNILAACVLIWSGFTAVCGISRNYLEFLLGRTALELLNPIPAIIVLALQIGVLFFQLTDLGPLLFQSGQTLWTAQFRQTISADQCKNDNDNRTAYCTTH